MSELGPIAAIRVFVFDIERAQKFYTEALGLTCEAATPDYCVYRSGTCSLVVERVAPEDTEDHGLVGRFTGLSFTVSDIAASYVRLRAKGVPFPEPPKRQDWGGMLAHFEDPSGNVLTIVQYSR